MKTIMFKRDGDAGMSEECLSKYYGRLLCNLIIQCSRNKIHQKDKTNYLKQ